MPGVGTFEAGKANFATLFETAKEVGEGTMETFERGIYDHSRQIRMSRFAMPLVLLVQMHVLTCTFVVSNQLFKAGIIHLARSNQGLHQGVFLCLRWSHAILKRSHDASITCLDYMVKIRAQAETRLTTAVETAWLAAG
jgi:hypothetical protein